MMEEVESFPMSWNVTATVVVVAAVERKTVETFV
jgi:hypothetical protein